MKKLEGLEAGLVNLLIKVGRAARADKNIDDLITEALEVVRQARQEGRDEAVDYIELHSKFCDDPKEAMIIYDDARQER